MSPYSVTTQVRVGVGMNNSLLDITQNYIKNGNKEIAELWRTCPEFKTSVEVLTQENCRPEAVLEVLKVICKSNNTLTQYCGELLRNLRDEYEKVTKDYSNI